MSALQTRNQPMYATGVHKRGSKMVVWNLSTDVWAFHAFTELADGTMRRVEAEEQESIAPC